MNTDSINPLHVFQLCISPILTTCSTPCLPHCNHSDHRSHFEHPKISKIPPQFDSAELPFCWAPQRCWGFAQILPGLKLPKLSPGEALSDEVSGSASGWVISDVFKPFNPASHLSEKQRFTWEVFHGDHGVHAPSMAITYTVQYRSGLCCRINFEAVGCSHLQFSFSCPHIRTTNQQYHSSFHPVIVHPQSQKRFITQY